MPLLASLHNPLSWAAANQNSSHCCQSKMAASGQQTVADAAAAFWGLAVSPISLTSRAQLWAAGTIRIHSNLGFQAEQTRQGRCNRIRNQTGRQRQTDSQTDMQHPSEQPTYMPEVPFQPLWGQEAPPPPPIVPYQELIAGFPCSDLCKFLLKWRN